MSYDGGWPVPPPGGWRPPGVRDQLTLILWTVIGAAVVMDVLLAVWLLYRPWGEMAGFARQMILCAAVPMNAMGVVSAVVRIWVGVRRRRHR
jgi:hypothetical protein